MLANHQSWLLYRYTSKAKQQRTDIYISSRWTTQLILLYDPIPSASKQKAHAQQSPMCVDSPRAPSPSPSSDRRHALHCPETRLSWPPGPQGCPGVFSTLMSPKTLKGTSIFRPGSFHHLQTKYLHQLYFKMGNPVGKETSISRPIIKVATLLSAVGTIIAAAAGNPYAINEWVTYIIVRLTQRSFSIAHRIF